MRKIVNKKLIISVLIVFTICCNFVDARNYNDYSMKDYFKLKIDLVDAKKIANIKLLELDKSNEYYIDNFEIIYGDDYSTELFFIFEFMLECIILSGEYLFKKVFQYVFAYAPSYFWRAE